MTLCRIGVRRLFLVLAFLPAAAFAALPPGVTKVTSVEGVDEYRTVSLTPATDREVKVRHHLKNAIHMGSYLGGLQWTFHP